MKTYLQVLLEADRQDLSHGLGFVFSILPAGLLAKILPSFSERRPPLRRQPDSKQLKCRNAAFNTRRMQVSRFRRVKPIRQMVDVFFSPLCTDGNRSNPQWRRKQLRLTIRKQQRGLCGGRTFAISAILLFN